MLALYHYFNRSGHKVSMVLPNVFPAYLAWLPGSGDILIFERNQAACEKAFRDADILFALDYNAPHRLGEAAAFFSVNKTAKRILIDHHPEPDTGSFDMVFSTTRVSSTAELVFNLIKSLDYSKMDKNTAECLYAGIVTDTGSFSYSCDYSETFFAVSELIRFGVIPSVLNNRIYSAYSENRMNLLGYCLSEKLRVYREYCTAYIALTLEELQRFGYKTGDTEGFVNYALSVEGMKFAAIFIERENKIRASFRSKGNFPVNDFARSHYAGGGHKNAAGGDSFESMQDTLTRFENLMKEHKESICNG